MKTIDISGVIVPADFDDAYFSSWIDKGVLTPDSRVVRAVREAAEAGEDLLVRVNSYGGNCVAGGNMLNALQDFTGKKTVEVGAFAASMAANIVLGLVGSCPVHVHRNTVMLFHSASTEAEGGAEALRDEAKFIDQLNGPVKEKLLALGVPAEQVEEGFSEGRQFTLSAEDLKKYGIASRILHDSVALPARPSGDPQDVAALKLVALYVDAPVQAEAEAEAEPEPEAEPEVPAAEEPAPEPEAEPVPAPEAELEAIAEPEAEPEADPELVEESRKAEYVQQALDVQAGEFQKRLAGLQAAKDKELYSLKIELNQATDERDQALATCEQLRAQVEETSKALADTREQLEQANRRQRRLVGAALQDTDDEEPSSKEEARRRLAALPMSQRQAYYQAHKGLID